MNLFNIETRTDLSRDREQKNKEDWWVCSCGRHHRGFPYKCPIKELKKDLVKVWSNCSSYRDFKNEVFYLVEEYEKR